jgi:hypothetical protein
VYVCCKLISRSRGLTGAHFTFLGSAAQAPNLNLSLNPNLMNTLFDHEKLEIAGGLN